MAKLTLDIDYDYDFFLLGLNSSEKDYILCYQLNKVLGTSLVREDEDLQLFSTKNGNATFSLYKHDDDSNESDWFLVSNKGIANMQNNTVIGLFDTVEASQNNRAFLIKEKKEIDYFIQIAPIPTQSEKEGLVKAIKTIASVQLVQEIDPTTLKSKDNLLLIYDYD